MSDISTLERSYGVKPKMAGDPFAIFASVRLTVVLLSLIAATVLTGAWCPQEAQVGQEKVIEQFGEDMAVKLSQWGITDIFHTPFFLLLIALLTLNLIVASFTKVFPRLKLLRQPPFFLNAEQIAKLPVARQISFNEGRQANLKSLAAKLKKRGFKITIVGDKLAGEYGKIGRLAPTTTHIGLLTLLLGVTITSWTGFSGFKPVRLGEQLSLADSQHSKLWIGTLPAWKVKVEATRRENYPTGEAQQWYSDLSVVDRNGHVLKRQEISVNNPLSFDGVDIYQSSWGMDQILLSFNGHEQKLDLRPMGKIYAAFLPLDEDTILIFSVKDQSSPLRLFAKRKQWDGPPKLLTTVAPGSTVNLGNVQVRYVRAIPVTGLQYKCDPGLWVTFAAFGFIMLGVSLAVIPHRHVWACAKENELHLGGRSPKARVGFERLMDRLVREIGLSSETELSSETGLISEMELINEIEPVGEKEKDSHYPDRLEKSAQLVGDGDLLVTAAGTGSLRGEV